MVARAVNSAVSASGLSFRCQMVNSLHQAAGGLLTGHAELRTNAHVAQIEHDAKGHATGVTYFDKMVTVRQKARLVP